MSTRPHSKLSADEIKARAVDEGTESGFDYDLIVIGGGSAGIAAARRAAELGAKVALCDFVSPSPQGTTWGLGGTCLNVGCVPKKLMHTAALQGEIMEHSVESYGWSKEKAEFNWNALKGNIEGHIRSSNFGYTVELRKKGIKYLNAMASFVDEHTLDCTKKDGTAERFTVRRVLIATGGRPTFPDIPGAVELGISSDDIFKLKKAPGKTLVVGAAYVALECAGFIAGLGFETACMMRSIPLRGFDQDMAGRVVSYMENHNTRFIRGCVPSALTKLEDGKIEVTYTKADGSDEQKESFDTVLFAIGRKPEVKKLKLEVTGVQLAPNGKIITDEFERTTVPHIYAIGDIIEGSPELMTVASKSGRLLSERLYNQGTTLLNYNTIPTTVFTPLEYGAVGLSEEKATEIYGMIEVYHTCFKPLEWTVPHLEDNVCYMKLIVNPHDNERVLGFHVLSPNAAEITQGVAVALKCGATKAHFDETIGIHPSIAEDMTTLKITKSSGADPQKTGC